MDRAKLLILFAFVVLASSSEIEDAEQKKRGAAKTSNINAIPTGAQKPEYTYTIYSQNPQNNPPSPTYSQSQLPNSFYPSQSASQYYQSPNTQDQSPVYPPQPQLNLIPPPSSSQFVPLNFLPNPGYQSKFQIIPSKSQNGNLQIAIIPQQSSLIPSSLLPFQSQSLFSPHAQQIQPQQNSIINQVPQGQYNFGHHFQPFSLTQPFGAHPSMFLFAQPNPYNNYVVPNPTQQLYNYFQSNPQAKYNLLYGGSTQSNPIQNIVEYDKYQGASSNQPISKDDNEINIHGNEYITSDTSNYKSSYSTGNGASYKS